MAEAQDVGGRILKTDVEQEMQRSYIDYAMSVIVDRALPDVRDGLKPVQRRILYSMSEMGLDPSKAHRKSAAIVGEVMGKYHPHGDAAIYDAMVRMGQDFSYRYPLIDAHGNFGSIDGDPPAAMRYTEARLSPLSMRLLADIDEETVDFIPNYDGTQQQPVVLPARLPNLLINGASGIAVGMATNIPPHNLGEVIDALVLLLDRPDSTVEDLMGKVKGPDFPTGALILGTEGIRDAYRTGRGRIRMRARAFIEPMEGGRSRIVVTEIPYMVNKRLLLEKIADLVHQHVVEGISDLRDESDRRGMRIVVEIRRDANARVVLNNLFKHTPLEETFGVIMLALVDNQPKVLNLRDACLHYLSFQRDVITRRSRFRLRKAQERAHILEGLRIALDHIDEIVRLIRESKSDDEAKAELMSRFSLSEVQAVAILDMMLRRLTGLEREKIEAEYRELLRKIAELKEILADPLRRDGVIREELLAIREKFADPRRTEIVREAVESGEFDPEDLIPNEEVVVTVTHQGYIKRLPTTAYRPQRRGGRGMAAISTRQEDFVEQLFVTTTHAYVLFFTNRGRVFRVRAHEIPEASRQARGIAIINLIQLDKDEMVQAAVAVRQYDDAHYLFMATRQGTVKKTLLSEFDSPRAGLIGVTLEEGDELIGARLTDGKQEVMLVTRQGQAIRFPEEEVRAMGRTARGVRGIALNSGDQVVAMEVLRPQADLLVATEGGFGKRTPLSEYRVTSRGGKGIRTVTVTERNGPVIGARVVTEADQLMIISSGGIMIRISVADIAVHGRAAQGVRVMKLAPGEKVVTLALLASHDEADEPAGDR
ncbi:MAG: DNA gyrase subunit A [Limnochordaceae bacterium]|nr:DNA gyrase subunit A [Limnochordaceae bacterium]